MLNYGKKKKEITKTGKLIISETLCDPFFLWFVFAFKQT